MKNKKEPADIDRSVLLYMTVYGADSDAVIRRLIAFNSGVSRHR